MLYAKIPLWYKGILTLAAYVYSRAAIDIEFKVCYHYSPKSLHGFYAKNRLFFNLTFMIEIATSLVLLMNAVTGSNSLKIEKPVNQPITLESYVREYFKGTPQLAEIAACESRFNHLDKTTGKIVRGKVNSSDVGVMQINEYYHLDTAKKLGIDIYTLEGNLEYAKILYGKQGSKPWISSSKCWSKTDSGNLAKAI